MIDSINMNFDEVARVRTMLDDNHFFHYVLHKSSHPNYTWHQAQQDYNSNQLPMSTDNIYPYPEEWLASYWMYYMLNGKYLQNARILDIGPGYNLYSIWSILNGASHVDCVEPDVLTFALGKELVQIRNLEDRITCYNESAESFKERYAGQLYDVVFLADVFGYLSDGPGLLEWLHRVVKARYIFLETNVIDTEEPYTPGKIPNRQVMQQIIKNQHWNPIFYYDYHDFVGHGEGDGAVAGLKEFYVLERS